MRYKPVNRVITVEFRDDPRVRGRHHIVVTPDYAEVRYGDTVTWNFQGLPPRAQIAVGNFRYEGELGTIAYKSGRVRNVTPRPIQDTHLKSRAGGNQSLGTAGYEVGLYKYDILVDGTVVLDPDMEIRGPRN